MLTHMLIQLQNIQQRLWTDSANQTRHQRPMPATRDIIGLIQILKPIPQIKTPSSNDFGMKRLLIDINSIIYQRYRHRFIQWKGPKGGFDVLDKVGKLVHT